MPKTQKLKVEKVTKKLPTSEKRKILMKLAETVSTGVVVKPDLVKAVERTLEHRQKFTDRDMLHQYERGHATGRIEGKEDVHYAFVMGAIVSSIIMGIIQMI